MKKNISILIVLIVVNLVGLILYKFLIFGPFVGVDIQTTTVNTVQLYFISKKSPSYNESFKVNSYLSGEGNKFEHIIFNIPKDTNLAELRFDLGDFPSAYVIKDLYIQPDPFTKIYINNNGFLDVFSQHNDIAEAIVINGAVHIKTSGNDGYFISNPEIFNQKTVTEKSFSFIFESNFIGLQLFLNLIAILILICVQLNRSTKKCLSIFSRNLMNKVNPKVIALICVTFIFLILYHKFIIGNFAYMYYDVGGDTFQSYYTVYYYVIHNLRNFSFDLLDLSLGFGFNSIFYLFYDFPFQIIVSFIPEQFAHIGLLLATYIKYMIICYFAYSYFGLFSKNKLVLITVSILWTYTSYNVLWGQHLFLSGVMYFTIHMFLLEKSLRLGGRYYIFLVLNLAFFASNIQNYVNFYTATIFSIAYIFIHRAYFTRSFAEIIKYELKIGLAYIFAIGLAAIGLLTFIELYSESIRTTASAGLLSYFTSLSAYLPQNKDEILLIIARLFGNNFIDMNSYKILNYYEIPMLFVSVLFFFAVAELLNMNKHKKLYLLLFTLICTLIVMPFFNYVFTLLMYRRWTYIIIFLMLFFILKFLDERIISRRSALLGYGFVVSMVCIEYLLLRQNNFIISPFNVLAILFFATLYLIIFFITGGKSNNKCKSVILLVVVFEMIAMNYYAVNERLIVKLPMSLPFGYKTERTEIVDKIYNDDRDFYRIVSDHPDTVLRSESLIHGNRSLSVYNSLLQQIVVDYLLANNLGSRATTQVVPNTNFEALSLLGVKYMLSHDKQSVVNIEGFEFLEDAYGINVYKNNNYLSFGYTYFNQIDRDYFLSLDADQKRKVSLKYFYSKDLHLEDMSDNQSVIDNIPQINFSDLKKVTLKDVVFKDSIFTGRFNNDTGKDGVMVIPVFNFGKWKLSLDGKEEKIFTVNDGLVGFIAPLGEHDIMLSFTPKYFKLSIIITVITFIGGLLFIYRFKLWR